MKYETSALLAVFHLILIAKNSECFGWTSKQRASYVIHAKLGSDVSLPCDFLLSAEEQYATQQFHLIYWTREMPIGSQSWQGLAVRTSLVSNSEPQIIYHDKRRIIMKGTSLKIINFGVEDEGQYQCEVKSSFYTTPALVRLTKSSPKASGVHLSNKDGASVGIGVGITLSIISTIVIAAILYKVKRSRNRDQQEHTSLETLHRRDAEESHVDPGVTDTLELINSDDSVENQHCLNEHVYSTYV